MYCMKVTIWIPAADSPRWPCVMSWLNINKPADCEEIKFVRSGANNVKYSWNRVIENFLKSDHDWLLSVHNDVVFEPDTLNRLLSWDKKLISALIFMRQSPIVPHIWKQYDDPTKYAHRIQDTREWFFKHPELIRFGSFIAEPRPEDALVPIDFTSTSCTLIHRSVLEGMRELVADVWFEWDDDYNGGGEDRRFFENAAKCGFEAFVDRSCVVGHLVGDIPTSVADFIAWENVSVYEDTGEPQQ